MPLRARNGFNNILSPIRSVGTTPLGSNQPKALLHSTALNDLIQESSLVRVPPLVEVAAFGFLLPLFGQQGAAVVLPHCFFCGYLGPQPPWP